MLISIITPFYCGNSYMAGFYQMVEKAAKEFLAQGQERSVEVIIVNDSPWERVELPENESHSFRLIVIDNKKNSGIHQSRVNGQRGLSVHADQSRARRGFSTGQRDI